MTSIELFLDPASARLIENDYRNVLLIANNPSITEQTVARLGISSRDIVVQFNRSPFFDIFSSISCHKTHIFNANGHGSYWGFTKEGEPDRDYQDQKFQELTFYFTFWLSDKAKSYLGALTGAAQGGILHDEWAPRHHFYPPAKKPTVGFQAVGHYKTMNSIRVLRKKPAMKLILVGFSGDYEPGRVWQGHDIRFEQSVYDTWLELVRLDHNGDERKP